MCLGLFTIGVVIVCYSVRLLCRFAFDLVCFFLGLVTIRCLTIRALLVWLLVTLCVELFCYGFSCCWFGDYVCCLRCVVNCLLGLLIACVLMVCVNSVEVFRSFVAMVGYCV